MAATLAAMLRIYLAHGAWGTAASMDPWLDGLAARGFEAHAVTLPRGHAERAVASFAAQVPDAPGVVVGGQSYGSRVASLLAARSGDPGRVHPFAALVCLSYPLHRPGRPETAADRVAHWPSIPVPTLLASGTRDPFAQLAPLEAAVDDLARADLALWPGLGHTLAPVRDEVLDRIAAFLRELEAADPPAASAPTRQAAAPAPDGR